MRLNNKYVIGTMVQFYELEMLPEHVKSCARMLKNIENKENVTFVFYLSTQQHLETIDRDYFKTRYPEISNQLYTEFLDTLVGETFKSIIMADTDLYPANLRYELSYDIKSKRSSSEDDEFYNIAAFRRDFTWEWSDKADVILWGETDSLWPSQTLMLIDGLHEQVKNVTPKYIVNFADRVLWDNSFAPLHPMYEGIRFVDDGVWQFENPASGKSYMSYEQMEEINSEVDVVKTVSFNVPRFDGSCVGFTSDLLCSGVTLPKSLILHSEDVAMGTIAKRIMGDNFVQYNFSNILHVHNRRHPKKRTGILNENNARGNCTIKDKGMWWQILEQASKHNHYTLFNQSKVQSLKQTMALIHETGK